MSNCLHLIKSILVHPGSAHMDEIYAVSLVLGYIPQTVQVARRIPTQAELDDVTVACIDVGRQFNVAKNNFDHHQMSSANTESSFVLVLKAMGLYQEAVATHDWVVPQSILDTQGPINYAKHVKLDNSADVVRSPMDEMLLADFELITDKPSYCPHLSLFGRWILDSIKERTRILAAARADVRSACVKHLYGFVWNRVEDWGIERLANTSVAKFRITRAGRAPGWKVVRINDAKELNFAKLSKDPRVQFAHTSGFMFNTKELIPLDELYKLIEQGMV